jgi:uncharacterized protein (DUF2141 family)
MIRWNAMSAGGKIIAESYKIYWGTDAAATNGTPIIVQANHNSYLQSITNGAYYYKISALVGTTESSPSPVVGPITIGAGVGLNTVSGTVTIPVTPTGPLYVGVTSGNGIYYFTRIASPTTSQAYSFSGVPNGTYRAFALLDQNNDGLLGIGNPSIDISGALPIVISNNNPTENITLSAANAISRVSTDHGTNGSQSEYHLYFMVVGMMKLPVQVSLASGQNIPVPLDMQMANNSVGEFSCMINLATISPALSDSYRFDVTYSDGTTEQLTAPVTAVLDSFVQSPSISGLRVAPTFGWSAPSSPLAFYRYYIQIIDSTNGNLIWNYPTNTPFGMPSTQTSVSYNADGNASQPALTSGTTYRVYFIVTDANFNRNWYETSYTP